MNKEREAVEFTAVVKSIETKMDKFHDENREDHRLIFEKFDSTRDYVDAKVSHAKTAIDHQIDKRILIVEKRIDERYDWVNAVKNKGFLIFISAIIAPLVYTLVLNQLNN